MKNILTILALSLSILCFSQNRHYYANLKKNKKESVQYSKKLLNSLKSDKQMQLEQLLVIEAQIQKENEIISIISKEQNLLSEELNYKKNEIELLNNDLNTQKNEYAKLIRFSWYNMNIQNRMIYVMSAKNFNNVYKRVLYLKQLSDYRKLKSLKIQESIDKLDSAVNSLEQLSIEKANLAKEKKTALDLLSVQRRKLDALINSQSEQISAIKKTMRSNQIRRDNIKKEVDRAFDNQYVEPVKKTIEKPKKKPADKPIKKPMIGKKISAKDASLAKSFRGRKGRHFWPLPKCVVLHRFGDYRHPKFTDVVIKNDGIELAASGGLSVHAIYNGKVSNIITIPGEGYSIIIKHGEYYSVYSNVHNLEVKLGDYVTTGQVIAYLNKNVKMAKMNFQIWHKKMRLNPHSWLDRR